MIARMSIIIVQDDYSDQYLTNHNNLVMSLVLQVKLHLFKVGCGYKTQFCKSSHNFKCGDTCAKAFPPWIPSLLSTHDNITNLLAIHNNIVTILLCTKLPILFLQVQNSSQFIKLDHPEITADIPYSAKFWWGKTLAN